MTELACYLARETALVNQVVRAGKARYSDKERSLLERIWVVPRRELFVPDVDEGFFVIKTMDDGRSNLKGGTHEH